LIIKDKKENLNKQLDIVEKALPGKTTMPLLNNIFLHLLPDKITFLTTNLEIGVRSTYNNQGGLELENQEGSLLLPPRIIDIIRNLPREDVEIDINLESLKMEVRSGSASFKISGITPEEYPFFIEKEVPDNFMQFRGKDLKDLIKKTIFAVSKDESRPVFHGVLFSIKEGNLSVIASDTYRLVIKEMALEQWKAGDAEFLIPGRALRELVKLLDDDSQVYVFPYENQLAFSFNGIFFFSRLIDEKFPEVKGVIPRESVLECTVNRELLEDTLNRASLVVDQDTQAGKISISGEEMVINTVSTTGQMEEKLSLLNKDGEDMEIYLNVKFLLEVLKVMHKENVLMVFSGKESPCIMKQEEDDSYLYLVLPIKME